MAVAKHDLFQGLLRVCSSLVISSCVRSERGGVEVYVWRACGGGTSPSSYHSPCNTYSNSSTCIASNVLGGIFEKLRSKRLQFLLAVSFVVATGAILNSGSVLSFPAQLQIIGETAGLNRGLSQIDIRVETARPFKFHIYPIPLEFTEVCPVYLMRRYEHNHVHVD